MSIKPQKSSQVALIMFWQFFMDTPLENDLGFNLTNDLSWL